MNRPDDAFEFFSTFIAIKYNQIKFDLILSSDRILTGTKCIRWKDKALEEGMRKLHIGGHVSSEGWEVLDVIPGPHVDHVGDAGDLNRFPDGSFGEIYASHVLEHFDYVDHLFATLKEWHRVLTPGGRLYVSVPDMDTLAQLFLDRENNSGEERFLIMRMIFGGHVNKHDFHLVGLNEDFLVSYLVHTGFNEILRVRSFGFFNDASEHLFKNIPISLNLIAQKQSPKMAA